MRVKDQAEYKVWTSMKNRCHNKNEKSFKNYGGRGITVCQEWRESYEAFLKAVGRRPTSQHQLDRINNDLGYQPGNVRWSTRSEQSRNRRSNKLLTHNGETMILTDWARRIGINESTLLERIQNWGLDRALSTKKLEAKPQPRMVSAMGQEKPLKQWAKETGINYRTLHGRLERGWSLERALTEQAVAR